MKANQNDWLCRNKVAARPNWWSSLVAPLTLAQPSGGYCGALKWQECDKMDERANTQRSRCLTSREQPGEICCNLSAGFSATMRRVSKPKSRLRPQSHGVSVIQNWQHWLISSWSTRGQLQMKGSNLTYVKYQKEVSNHRFKDQPLSKEKCFKLGLHNVSKIYRHRSIRIAENCLNFSKLHSLYSLYTFCVTMYLAD